jgi:hypothetical protein
MSGRTVSSPFKPYKRYCTLKFTLLKKATRDGGPQHVGDGKFEIPSSNTDPAAQSMLMVADFSDCSTWMTAFSVTHMLWT